MDAKQHKLRLPDGYVLQSVTDKGDRRFLALGRADGSTVALFEFSAIGPDPRRIWQIAWEDFEAASDTDASETT